MLGPGDGARRRHDQAAELRPRLTLTTRGELETTSACVRRRTPERRRYEALAGFKSIVRQHMTGPSRLPLRAAYGRP